MSTYQFVYFQAVDRPLDDRQLAFMARQSSRAEISPWAFTNEYHYGDFHGDAVAMLRRGYDVHLHYANFGIRRLLFRLPTGLPCDKKCFEAYRVDYAVEWKRDRKGDGGILEIQPEADAGTFAEEYVLDFEHLKRAIVRVRELLLEGDLRPLYLAWLACQYDEEAMEPPVPAGLRSLPPELATLAKFYEIDADLISAAAARSATAAKSDDERHRVRSWVDRQSKAELRELAWQFLTDDSAGVRAQTLARIRGASSTSPWPTAEPTRTLGELRTTADQRRSRRENREKLAREKARRMRLDAVAAHPNKTVAHVKRLVKQRSTANYEQAAHELVELREALGPERGPKRVQAVAEKLVAENPTLRRLKSALKKHGLMDA